MRYLLAIMLTGLMTNVAPAQWLMAKVSSPSSAGGFLSAPHRCTCGCEVTGQCVCPNCSVGCGFLKPPTGKPPWTPEPVVSGKGGVYCYCGGDPAACRCGTVCKCYNSGDCRTSRCPKDAVWAKNAPRTVEGLRAAGWR